VEHPLLRVNVRLVPSARYWGAVAAPSARSSASSLPPPEASYPLTQLLAEGMELEYLERREHLEQTLLFCPKKRRLLRAQIGHPLEEFHRLFVVG